MNDHKIFYLLVILCAVFVVGAVYLFVPSRKELLQQESVSSVAVRTTAETTPEVTVEPTTEPSSEQKTEAAVSSTTVVASNEEMSSTEATSADATSSQETTSETTAVTESTTTQSTVPTTQDTTVYDLAQSVFIGDSRVLFLGTSDKDQRYLDYLPCDRIFAKFSGTIVDEYAYANVKNAAALQPSVAVFWFGINDVQIRENRDDADAFVKDYAKLVSAYLKDNPNSAVKIIAILSTSPYEPDYYSKQDANIAAYNKALKKYAEENGFSFIDISGWSLEEAFFPDSIHFNQTWMDAHIDQLFSLLNITK